jgi:hypothetical protein
MNLKGAPRRQAIADDLRAAVDWAEKENTRDGSPLKSKIAMDRVAVMGQSCGGFLSIVLTYYFGWNVPWGILSLLLTAGAVVMLVRGVGVSTRLAGLFFGFEMLVLVVVSAPHRTAAFEAATVESLKTTGGHRVGVSPSIASQVVDNDKLIAWAKANGYERKLTLYAPTVLAIVKERLTEGQTLPDGVEARGFDKVTFTR